MAGSKSKGTLLRPFIETSWVHDIDEEGTPQYYGRTDIDGNWVIYSKNGGTIRYAGYKNNSDYEGNLAGYIEAWTNRASLTYGYLSEAV